MFRYLPEQASEIAPKVDWLHNWITDISVFFTVLIVGAMIYFAIRYRKKDGKNHDTPQIKGSHFLEVVWTVVPTLICIFVAYYGVVIFKEMRHVSADAVTVNVWGSKWEWNFDYPTGKRSSGELVVPVDQPIKLVLQSRDVLHSFFIPAMRVKTDAIKGYYTYLNFKPVRTGEFHIFCTEYCGKDHSAMRATLRVVSPAEYERWVNDMSEKMSLADKGQVLYKKCASCHSLDGSRVVGPSFLKLFGREEELEGGQKVKVDEEYIRESIREPQKKVVKGYPPQGMNMFDTTMLSDDDVVALIEFIKTVDGTKVVAAPTPPPVAAADLSKLSPAERGKRIFDGSAGSAACSACHSLDGSKIVGPTFKGIYGRAGTLADGSSYTADDAYIKESILNPSAKVAQGYPPAMPPFQLSDDQINDVVEFLKTVK